MKKQFALISLATLLLTGCGAVSTASDTTPANTTPTENTTVDTTTVTTPDCPIPEEPPFNFGLEDAEIDPTLVTVLAQDKLTVGETLTAKVTKADDVNVLFLANDPQVALINQDGLVSAVAPGKATFYVVAKTEDGAKGVVKKFDVEVYEEVPTLRKTIDDLNNIKNYTLLVNKNDEEFETIQVTKDTVVMKKVTEDGDVVRGFALGKNGVAFPFNVTDDGVVVGDMLKDQQGYVKEDTFLGWTDNPYYANFRTFSSLSTAFLPDTETDDGVYDLRTYDDATSDRDTVNTQSLANIMDFDLFTNMITARATISNLEATVKKTYDLFFEMTAKIRKGNDNNYDMTVTNVGTTTIDPDLKNALADKNGNTVATDPDLVRGVGILKNAKSFTVNKGVAGFVTATERYYVFSSTDEQIVEAYDNYVAYPEYYSFNINNYQTSGYVLKDDGIYLARQTVTFDTAEKKVTRGAVVLDDYPSYEVIPLDTAFTYPSKFKFLDHIDEFIDSGLYMSYGMGYGTFNKKYVEEVFNASQNNATADYSSYGMYNLTPYALTFDFSSNPTFIQSGVVAEKDEDCVINLYCGHQTYNQVGKSSGYNYSSISYADFNRASLPQFDALFVD